MRAGLWICLIFLVPACAPGPVAPPGASVVRSVAKAGAQPPLAQGEARLIVRTFAAEGPEVRGAECLVDAPWFQARATSPAEVLMPAYGGQSPTLSVTCEANGARGQVAVAPRSVLNQGYQSLPAVGVSVNSDGGVGLGLGWYGGGYGAGVPVVGYPEAQVVLQPG